MNKSSRFACTSLATLLLLAACRTSDPAPPRERPLDPELQRARALYDQGKLTEAMIAAIDIGHSNPTSPGLAEFRAEIMTALNDRRERDARTRRDDSMTRTMLESQHGSLVPDTFRMRRGIQGNDSTHIRPKGPMDEVLDRTLSLHFDEVNLREILAYLGQEGQLNLIADRELETPTVTIHAEDITIRELFDYLSRNLDVEFNLGRNIIWVTPSSEPRTSAPMFTRVYRIRHGVHSQYLSESGLDPSALRLLEAIERFVPMPDGSDIMFDENAHILLVKNSEKNLAIVDNLVEVLDITPPQVLIEARFISTSVSDLRELGIDWLLQSNVVLSERGGRPRIRLEEGATVGFGESVNAGDGFTGTFSGILTDPQFRAVLHALELKGDARTLSAPKVIAVNNRPAFIRIGRDLAYVSDVRIERETFGTGDQREDLLIRDPVVETLETGYELTASVSVGANMRDINLRLRPEIVELIRFREVSQRAIPFQPDVTNGNGNGNGNGVPPGAREIGDGIPGFGIEFPELARSIIETEVVVQSGDTVAMGGLMRQREQDDRKTVPFIGALPIIGRLFTRTSVVREQENLLVFVTATLISKRGEDLVPLEWLTPEESDTRGRFILDNAPLDESIPD